MNQSLFYIAIIPPKPVFQKIKVFQKVLSEQFDSQKAYHHTPHITLIPPFRVDTEDENKLKEIVEKISNSISSFEVNLDGFSHFKNHTIFAIVEHSDKLTDLQTALKKSLKNEDQLLTKPISYYQWYNPHLTIGYGDLKPNFKNAWEYFKNEKVNEQFQVSKISILQYDFIKENWSIKWQPSLSI